MQHVKKYISYLIMTMKPAFLVYFIVTTLLTYIFTIQMRMDGRGAGDELLEVIRLIPLQVNTIYQLILGIVCITPVFEIGMRIRADRKSILWAIGLVSIVLTIGVTLWGYALNWVSMRILQLNARIQLQVLYENREGLKLFSIYLGVLMMGILVASLYKKFGIVKLLIGGVIISGVSIGIGIMNPEGVLNFIKEVAGMPFSYLLIAVLCYGISIMLLIELPINGYKL